MDSPQKSWFTYVAQNPDWVDTNVTALFFVICYRSEQLGGRTRFQLPALDAMERLGIRSPKTYYAALKKLTDAGFVTLVEEARNQYSACIIDLNVSQSAEVKNASAPTEARTEATSAEAKNTLAHTEAPNAEVEAEANFTEAKSAEVGAAVGAEAKNAEALSVYRNNNITTPEKESKKEKGSKKSRGSEATIVALPPTVSPEFKAAWQTLTTSPKWRNKPQTALQLALTKLLRYDDAFAVQLMEKAIMGNYQGVVFDDTDAHYGQWQKEQRLTRPFQPATAASTTTTGTASSNQPAYYARYGSPGRVIS